VKARTSVLISVLLLIPWGNGWACSIFPKLFEVGSVFNITVTDRGKAVANLPVFLSTGWVSSKKVLKIGPVVTDQLGIAHFIGVPKGDYSIGTPIGISQYKVISVSKKLEAVKSVPFQWPEEPVVSSRAIRGKLDAGDRHPKLKFKLFDAFSGSELLTTDDPSESSDGDFDFGVPHAGMYLLRISEVEPRTNFPFDGDIFIEVTSNSDVNRLDIGMVSSSCGLSYAQACKQEPITVPKLCGNLVDPQGAAIPNANLDLISQEGHSPTRSITSDHEGYFSFEDLADGVYEVKAKSQGFIPGVFPVRVEETRIHVCKTPIEVTLSIGRSCSGRTRIAESNAPTH
jgi:hypothetical protein